MNLVSRLWLNARQNSVRELATNYGLCLDIGCGDYPIYPDATTLDVDESVKVDYHSDACDLPFEDKSFDRIFCLETIEHISDHETFYSEASRVLKFGGILVITSPINSSGWKVIWFLWSRTFGRKWLGTHRRYFNADEMSERFMIIRREKIHHLLWLVVGLKR